MAERPFLPARQVGLASVLHAPLTISLSRHANGAAPDNVLQMPTRMARHALALRQPTHAAGVGAGASAAGAATGVFGRRLGMVAGTKGARMRFGGTFEGSSAQGRHAVPPRRALALSRAGGV